MLDDLDSDNVEAGNTDRQHTNDSVHADADIFT